LILNEHTAGLFELQKPDTCYQCIIKEGKVKLRNDELNSAFEEVKKHKMNNYSKLKDQKWWQEEKYLVTLTPTG
jgi:hypothetical protein